MKSDQGSQDTYSEAETVARREAALSKMLATPPTQHKELKAAGPRTGSGSPKRP